MGVDPGFIVLETQPDAKLAPVQETASHFIALMSSILSPTLPFIAAISLVLKKQR